MIALAPRLDPIGCLATRPRGALPRAMQEERVLSGLAGVLVAERARLLRFLAARGAGDQAEDVLQDLWSRVAEAPQAPVADPVAYLFRAAENLLRDRRRSTLSRERRQTDWQDAHVGTHQEADGERLLIARERLREAQDVLAAQGGRVAHVFQRYRLDGIGQAAIARELGVSLSSVEKDLQRAYRALAELRRKFDEE
ncbi:RNA polymerase sigma-70 factor, ECF subfamily [Sphingomonas guangdongensis]|uniref:RNA polymerase sigma-70 factor, ECF subfamily n=1 Tax=Sphingomonas guangdongensis TaxID=1141890 RepID=A0A285QGD4_9SPHN|nr:RNA polymerase sigma-70 factor, ECF subfamily [Sphingomonas guangdongensis]